MNHAGRHGYADAYLRHWPGDDAVFAACEAAIAQSRMNVVACTHKKFDPQGLTAVWILAESHFTLHTYPEHRYISVDCYTCGDEGDPAAAIDHLLDNLPIEASQTGQLRRGSLPAPVGVHQSTPAGLDVRLDAAT